MKALNKYCLGAVLGFALVGTAFAGGTPSIPCIIDGKMIHSSMIVTECDKIKSDIVAMREKEALESKKTAASDEMVLPDPSKEKVSKTAGK